MQISEEWIAGLRRHEAFTIDRIPSGTNRFRLRVRGIDPVTFQQRLGARGVMLTRPQGDAFLVGVNETYYFLVSSAAPPASSARSSAGRLASEGFCTPTRILPSVTAGS